MTSIKVIITATDEYRRTVKTLAERDHIFFLGGVSDYLRDVIDDFNKTFFAARRLAIPDKELHPEGDSKYRAVWKIYGVVLEEWERTTDNLWGEVEMRPKSKDQALFSLDWKLDNKLGEDYFNVLSRLLKERHGFDLIPAAPPRDGGQGGQSHGARMTGRQDPRLPKTGKTLEKYKDAWAVIQRMQKEYAKKFKNLDTDDPTPSPKDYCDALASSKLKWKRSTKTVSHVIALGEAGLLRK